MANKIHVVQHEGMVISPFLTKDKPTYQTNDKLVIEQPDGTQKSYDIDFVARDKVNKGWCYLALEGPQGVLAINDIPDSVG